MPVMDGFEATQAIRTFYKENGIDKDHYLIVGLSAMTAQEDKEKSLRIGMNNFSKIFIFLIYDFIVTKPPKLAQL